MRPHSHLHEKSTIRAQLNRNDFITIGPRLSQHGYRYVTAVIVGSVTAVIVSVTMSVGVVVVDDAIGHVKGIKACHAQ